MAPLSSRKRVSADDVNIFSINLWQLCTATAVVAHLTDVDESGIAPLCQSCCLPCDVIWSSNLALDVEGRRLGQKIITTKDRWVCMSCLGFNLFWTYTSPQSSVSKSVQS